VRIWFTEIGEPLPLERNARLYRYGMLTQSLVRYGHEVVWWTSSFSHISKRHVTDQDSNVTINDVNIHLLKGPGYKRNVSISRVFHQMHFARKFYRLANNHGIPDVIISSVPTIEVAEKAVLFGKAKNIPVIVDIRDEWPDEFVDLAPKFLRQFVRVLMLPYFKTMTDTCKNATAIIGVSRSFRDYALSFAQRDAGRYDRVFPIGYSVSSSLAQKKIEMAKDWWISQGVKREAFVCCFFGTIGKFFDLGVIIQAAKKLSTEFPIQLVLCGDGSRLSYFKKTAVDADFIFFPGWVDEPKIRALMDIAHVGLAPYAANSRMSLPNKPFEYFAGSLPVVSSIKGELREILEKHQCGRTYNPESLEDLCSILRDLHAAPTLCQEMGIRGRMLLEQEFSTDRIASSFNEYLVDVVVDFRRNN
jgi:glycosyltransferase involved in cell wall biosynthesis